MPEVKNVLNLQLRSQKFVDAGMTMARRAVEKKSDPREKHSTLAVSAWLLFIAVSLCVF